MKIVVNHLTRMQPGYICVAGIDLDTNRHVRPVIEGSMLTSRMLKVNGGFFELGHLLDLGKVEYVGRAPEIEDYHFDPRKITRMGKVSPTLFWKLLKKAARPSFQEIFGPALKPSGHGAIVKIGAGQASLGCLRLNSKPEFYVDEQDRLRIRVNDGIFNLELRVTDLRFYEADYQTPKQPVIEQVTQWCESADKIILSVGLSRPWQKPNDTIERHWLQMNNIHFEQHPVW